MPAGVDKERARRLLLRALIASLCATALVAILDIGLGRFADTDWRAVLTAGALALYSLIALLATNTADDSPRFALATFVTCSVGLLLAALSFWLPGEEHVALHRWAWGALFVALSEGQAALLLARRRPSDSELVRGILTATLVLIAVVALMAAVDVIALHDSGTSQGYVRLMGIAFVLDILGCVLMPILRKVEQTERKPPA